MANQDDATVSHGAGDGADAGAPGGTIGRFVVEGTLGAGGMGVVVAARDPTLHRAVAIKLLRNAAGGEEGRTRLQREAQAMARVQHPNVATVYEVGTVGEQLFVAMELVDGQTLKGWLRERARAPREALAMLIAAGRGLAAVHAAGIAHRDFKPDNVLVGKDGRPRVSDFGLVSLRGGVVVGGGAGNTVSAAGTPAYMSPEQVRGEVGDALSDQFSFSVTLWEALFGERPFADDAPPEARHAPERVVRGRVPSRVASIVSRGLASRPQDRWPSMEAMLAELERDTGRRLRLAAVVSLALIGVVSLGGWLQSRYSAAMRVQRASELGREAQQMRTMMRAAHMLPLHDIKPDRDKVRAILKRIESELPDLGGEVHAQAEAALGAGYFALNDRATALKHLQAAWDAGQRSPEVAFDLGQALVTELQRQQLGGAGPADPEEAKRRDEELKKKFRDPAIAILHQAGGAADTSPEYLEEVIAWAERRTADVEQHGEIVFRDAPTLYEAGLLVASAYARQAFFAIQSGKGDADALYHRADAMYKKVLETGRSDEAVYRLAGDHLSLLAYQRSVSSGKDTGAELRAMVELCEKGRAADSEATWPDEMISRLYMHLNYVDSHNGREYKRDQDDAIAAAERAVKRDPKAFKALSFMGMALTDRADMLDDLGEDPRPAIESAIEAFTKSIAAGGAIDSICALGQGKAHLARWQMAHGLDPTATIEAAIKDTNDAARIAPEDFGGVSHRLQCLILADRARDLLAQGKDGRAWLERAAPICAQGAKERAGEPQGTELPGYLADAEALAAAQSGGDPLPAWQRAQPAFEAAIKLDPNLVKMRSDLVDLLAARAEYQSAHGHDGRADVTRAITEGRGALAGDPKDPQSHRALARAELAAVRVALRAKKNPATDLKEGLASVDRALAIKKDDGTALAIGVQLELIAAPHDKEAITRGQALLTRALALHATHPRLLFFRSEFERLSGDAARADATRKEAVAAGPQLEAWAKAFAVEP